MTSTPASSASPASPDHVGIHATHCCAEHGCKYGDEDCPVVTGKVQQRYDCEECIEHRGLIEDQAPQEFASSARNLLSAYARYSKHPDVVAKAQELLTHLDALTRPGL